jgi:transcriptional regulator with XRE-family HTH domain
MARSSPKLFKPLYVGEWVAQSGRQQEDIADRTGITDAYLSELISGKKKNPSAHVLRALSEELGITVNDLYRKPPSAAQLDRLKNLSPSDAATLARLLDQAKGLKWIAMALKPCSECKRPISEDAKACPNCGAPNMAAVYKARRAGCGVILVIVAILAIIVLFTQH